MWWSGTRACARCSRSGLGCRGRRFWRRRRRRLSLWLRRCRRPSLRAALSAAAGRGFDLSRELPLRAHLFVLSAERACAAAGAAPHRRRRLVAGSAVARPVRRSTGRGGWGLRRGCLRCRCSTPTTRCGSARCWARRAMPAARCRAQLSYWRSALADLPEQIELPFDRSRPAVSSHRGGSVPVGAGRVVAWRAVAAFARRRGEPVHGAAGRCCGAAEPAGGGAPTSRWAARSRGAATRRWTIWSGSSSTRWCCAPTCRATRGLRELVGRVRAGNLAAYGHQDLPFERLVEVLNPARSLSRHPLFQVMLAFQSQGLPALELAGLSVRRAAGGDGEREVRPVGERVGAARCGRGGAGDRGGAGIRQRPVRAGQRCGAWASGWCGCWRRRWRSRSARSAALDDAVGGRARATAGGLERHGAAGCGGDAAGAVCGAGGAHAGRGGGGVRGAAAELRGARCARQPAGASPARPGGRVRRRWWGCAWSARRRW